MLRTHPSLVALSLLVEPGMNSTALSVKGFEVSVKINNQLTPVYQPKSDAKGATATGYIASEEGATFSVHFKDVTPSPGRTHPLSCRVFIDGTKMGSQLLLEGDMETSFNGKQMSDTSRSPFLFTTLKTTDEEDRATSDEQFIKSVGSIVIKVHRVASIKEDLRHRVYDANPNLSVIDERAKKGSVSHQTMLGAAETIRRGTRYRTVRVDKDESPYAEFVLHYRSRISLEIQGIAPAVVAEHELVVEPVARKGKRAAAIVADEDDDDVHVVEKQVKKVKNDKVKEEKVKKEKDGVKIKKEGAVASESKMNK